MNFVNIGIESRVLSHRRFAESPEGRRHYGTLYYKHFNSVNNIFPLTEFCFVKGLLPALVLVSNPGHSFFLIVNIAQLFV